jgi:Rrf2 family cysteine metabolism transcriptional repressor
MKLSTRGRYGVRLMLELALHYGEGPILLKDIAGRQGISEKYLWQLINPLKTAGLVNSLRGARGGYMLGKAPDAVSLKAILLILEGSLCLVDCRHPASPGRSGERRRKTCSGRWRIRHWL